jgi:hypothetical protein
MMQTLRAVALGEDFIFYSSTPKSRHGRSAYLSDGLGRPFQSQT